VRELKGEKLQKTKIKRLPMLFPHATVLVGADVGGQPDFIAVAWVTIACGTPPHIAIALNRVRHSFKGVKQNMAFSVNIPSRALVKETDYCGLATGAETDKVRDCHFEIFYGEVAHAPFIGQCPVNIGCEVEHIVRLGSHYLIAGVVREVLVADDCLTDGKPDAAKIDPLLVVATPALTYHAVGESLGAAFRIGKKIKKVEYDRERQRGVKEKES
jgi:flavin reductase (DIM6/NTAB) family NADH-FMN oxidoreductase RutF